MDINLDIDTSYRYGPGCRSEFGATPQTKTGMERRHPEREPAAGAALAVVYSSIARERAEGRERGRAREQAGREERDTETQGDKGKVAERGRYEERKT